MTLSRNRFGLALALVLALAAGVPRPAAAEPVQTIVLAGGCFWGMEAVFGSLNELVGTGTTGHAESVRVTYDPAKISLEQILNVYFLVAHDPTELNRQGPDDGTQYRSAIFVANDDQRRIAQAEIDRLTAEHRFNAPIVTKLEAYRGFYPAEAYHRHFVALHPDYPYVVFNDLPKLAALKQDYPRLVAQK
jgi:peptide-methionine (S)-S-oxide reductase